MKIIDNKKDYYDYLSGVYGTDELAVYDRRGSVTWAQYKERFPLFIDTKRVKDDVFIPPQEKPVVAAASAVPVRGGRETAVPDHG